MLIGVVGKPSSGKSTFFKASTLAEAEIANYPFTTIKPNRAVGFVKIECVDKEFGKRCEPREGFCINGNRFVPVELLDVAGLVPGAHKGLGLGTKFLDDLRQADVLIHVVDISGSINEKGEAVEPLSYDPLNDVEFLEYEIDMWFLGLIKKGWEKFARQVKQEGHDPYMAIAKQLSGLNVSENLVKAEIANYPADICKWTDDDLKNFTRAIRKRTKPLLIAANKIDVNGSEKNLMRLKEKFPDYLIIPCSSESELVLRQAAKHELIKYIPGEDYFEILKADKLNEQQKKALDFIDKNILKKYKTTGVQDVLNKAVFDFLHYIAVFPVGMNKLEDQYGRVLPDCFLIPAGSTALNFAFKIHTDLGKNFIRAIDLKTKMTVGKEHKLKHRDVVEIISGK